MDGQKRQPHLQMLIIKKPVDQAKSLSFASANVVAEGQQLESTFLRSIAPEDRHHHRGDKSDPDLRESQNAPSAPPKPCRKPAPDHSPRLMRVPGLPRSPACALF